MSVTASDRQLTYEEERGKPMPSLQHSRVQMRLILQLGGGTEFESLTELSLEIGQGQWRTPDVCVYLAGKLLARREQVRVAEPPLLTVEILSPTQSLQDLWDNTELYFAHGVKSCWIVVPTLRAVTIRVADGREFRHLEGIVIDPVTGLKVDMDALFV